MTSLAAKVAGYDWVRIIDYKPLDHQGFNPLGDDGDAFKLMVDLMLKVDIRKTIVSVEMYVFNETVATINEFFDDDAELREKAVRRAIVRASAETQRRKAK